MHIKYKKVILHNFGSYAHSEINLEDKGFCLISGINNYIKDNAASNGAGKSFIWSAICYALTGETISGLSSNLKNIYNTSDDTCWVTLDFTVDNTDYLITRWHKPKSDLIIIKGGIDISGKGIRESEKILSETLPDLTKSLISATTILGQGLPEKFSAYPPSGRKELLEKLTNSDVFINEIKERVANRQAELNIKLREKEDAGLVKSTLLTEKQTDLQKQQNEYANFKIVDYDALIKEAEIRLTGIKADSVELQKQKQELDQNKIDLQLKAETIKTEKAEQCSLLEKDYSTAISTILPQKTAAETELKFLLQEIKKINEIKDVCPTCGRKLDGIVKPDCTDKKVKVDELNNQLEELNKQFNKINITKQKYLSDINMTFNSTSQDIANQIQSLNKQLNSVIQLITDNTHFEQLENSKILELTTAKQASLIRYEELEKNCLSLTSEIKALEVDVSLINKELVALNEHIKMVRQIESVVKRDFRGFLLSGIINFLNNTAKSYSEIVFGTTELTIELNGNNLDISYCNKPIESLSGGERTRVDIITQFAIRELLTTYFNFYSNIIVLDEVTDFLDKISCAAVLQLIQTKLSNIESVFIISHHAEELDLPIDSEICVIKDEQGISSIVA